jgi:hypothetical protein
LEVFGFTTTMSSEATEGQTPDIYGQLHPVETPELIARKRNEFDQEIQKIPDANKKNLVQAQQTCPQLVIDLQLLFLRSEVFNADLAAARFANYWDKRVQVFGTQKAFQPLTLNAALCDDMVALKIGLLRLTGAKDPKGRVILFIDPSRQDRTKYTRDSMVRAVWYMIHSALEEVSAQQYGVVFLGYPHNSKFAQFDRVLVKTIIASIQGCLPIRLAGFHLCRPPSFIAIILPIVKLFMIDRLKKRISIHGGSVENVLASLELYGIDRMRVPEDLGGGIVLKHDEWLQERKAKGL